MPFDNNEENNGDLLTAGMGRDDYECAIEAILFAAGHPVTYEQLAKTFEIPVSEMRAIVESYAARYNHCDIPRGVTLITFDSCCQLCTRPDYISLIRQALGIRKSSGTLSASTIEALTIVAYQQPVTRAYIDSVRNADSTYAITNLLDRGLIEPKGRMDVPGRPILYGTTNAFLRCFGLSSLDDLPGNTGEAARVFRSIDEKLGIGEGKEDAQINMDAFLSNAEQTKVPMRSEPDHPQLSLNDALTPNAQEKDAEFPRNESGQTDYAETDATEDAERMASD